MTLWHKIKRWFSPTKDAAYFEAKFKELNHPDSSARKAADAYEREG